MRLRYYNSADLAAVKQIHAEQGFDYPLPDLDAPEFLVRAVLERDDESIAAAVFLRKTAETFLLMPPNHDSKKNKLGQLLILEKELPVIARRVGLKDVYCVVPPSVEDRFGKLLAHLGWQRGLWQRYEKEVG